MQPSPSQSGVGALWWLKYLHVSTVPSPEAVSRRRLLLLPDGAAVSGIIKTMGAANPSTGTDPPPPSLNANDDTPEPMDLLDANGEVVYAAATADTDAPSTTSSMPGGVEKEAAPGEEHPRAALPEFKSDADALLAWRAREALLIWGKSSSATWFEVRASARDPTESDNFEPSELPPPPTMEPRAPTMDLAPKEEMPSPAADALAEREVMTLTIPFI